MRLRPWPNFIDDLSLNPETFGQKVFNSETFGAKDIYALSSQRPRAKGRSCFLGDLTNFSVSLETNCKMTSWWEELGSCKQSQSA